MKDGKCHNFFPEFLLKNVHGQTSLNIRNQSLLNIKIGIQTIDGIRFVIK